MSACGAMGARPCAVAAIVGRDTLKCTLFRGARPSFAKWPGLPQLKQIREDGLREGIRHGWVLGLGSWDLGVNGERPRTWERVRSRKRLRSREGAAPNRSPRGLVVGLCQWYDPRSRWAEANADGRVCCEVLAAISQRRQVSGTYANEVAPCKSTCCL